MRTIRHQISFFTPGAVYGNMAKVMTLILSQCGEVLDAPPTSLPVPPDAPPDIPRMIFRSSEGNKELSLRLDRIDAVIVRDYENFITDEDLIAFQSEVISWITPLVEQLGVQISRLGTVFQRVMLTEEPPAIFLSRKYCRDKFLGQPFGNSHKFEIHNLKNYNYRGSDINSWVRVQTLTESGTERDVISVVNDLNHIPAETTLSLDHMRDFIGNSNQETINILKHYDLRPGGHTDD